MWLVTITYDLHRSRIRGVVTLTLGTVVAYISVNELCNQPYSLRLIVCCAHTFDWLFTGNSLKSLNKIRPGYHGNIYIFHDKTPSELPSCPHFVHRYKRSTLNWIFCLTMSQHRRPFSHHRIANIVTSNHFHRLIHRKLSFDHHLDHTVMFISPTVIAKWGLAKIQLQEIIINEYPAKNVEMQNVNWRRR